MSSIKNFLILSILLLLQKSTSSDSDSNPAKGKKAEQSGTYRGRVAGYAVDGYTDPTSDGSFLCSIADTSDLGYSGRRDYAWWQVDLLDPYNITSVTVYSNDWRTLNGFSVFISPTSDVSDAGFRYFCNECWLDKYLLYYYYQDTSNGSLSYTVNCVTPRIGRYVTVKRNRGTEATKLTLCEVEVEGDRYYYCDNCPSSPCNNTHGCSQCKPGYQPPSCTNGCELGTYGVNCAQRCPQCSDTGLACDPVTGICMPCSNPNGCLKDKPNENTTSAGPASNDNRIRSSVIVANGKTTSAGPASSDNRIRSSAIVVAGFLILYEVLKITGFC